MRTQTDSRLHLRAGELVEIRSAEEILATLDAEGRLDDLPFMPEMLAYAGKRVPVASRADKTCDTVSSSGLRRLRDTVHLDGLRCDGAGHGGCQAACLIFWKEAWLKRAAAPDHRAVPASAPRCTEHAVEAAARSGEAAWSCQATNLLRFTTPLPWWDLRQYVRDYLSGNVTLWAVLRGWFYFVFRKTIRIKGYKLQVQTFNAIQRARGSMPFPEFEGTLTKTPSDRLNLEPGELVQIKDVEEIRETLNKESLNRGLTFDVEMALHCGRTFRVRSRVTQIINERTGKMMKLPGDCIVLEGAICKAHYHQNCPRAIFPYWREVWLKRLEQPAAQAEEKGNHPSVMLKELWHYKELFYFLAWREVKLRYRQTLLGALWAIIQPLFTMLLFTVVFGSVVKTPTDGAPYPVFYYAALLPWMYFSTTVTMSGSSLVANAPLITKVYFPRVILPLAPALSGLLDFAIGFIGLAVLLLIYRIPPSLKWLLWPVPMLLLIMLAGAIGTFLAALNVKYRDVKYAVPFLLQLWLFATPIVYPARLLTGHWKWLLTLNPLTGIIGAFRAACVTGGVVDWPSLGVSAAAVVAVTLVAGLYFRRVEETMSDVI